MDTSFVNEAVPFEMAGNKRYIPRREIEANPSLKEFIDTFPASFEYSATLDGWVFIEDSP
jgi:hypothetical protein